MKATAVYRPRRDDVAVMIGEGPSIRSHCLPVDSARALHASLGQALKLASHRGDPVGAVK